METNSPAVIGLEHSYATISPRKRKRKLNAQYDALVRYRKKLRFLQQKKSSLTKKSKINIRYCTVPIEESFDIRFLCRAVRPFLVCLFS